MNVVSDFVENLAERSSVCVVAFSSRPERFEWGGTLGRIGVDHVLMRDGTERWYQGGVAGIGDVRAVVDRLEEIKNRYARVLTLGLSSGSYAALMFGQMARVEGVAAISPITGKGDAIRDDFEPRWHHRIAHGPEHPPVPDLKPMFRFFSWPEIRAFVSDGEGTELDRRMAERVGIGNIAFIPGYSHAGLARHMRDAGLIAQLVAP